MAYGAEMRILISHNGYQHRGGEDTVVEAEILNLRTHGHEVETYTRDNHDVASMSWPSIAYQTVWARKTVDDVSLLIDRFQPDLIHSHNTFPLISPSLYWAAWRKRIPVVQTLHNFRMLCLNAIFLREGGVCESCLGRLPWRGVMYRCYRGSAMASGALLGSIAIHRAIGTFRDKVTRYIALNEFCRQKFIAGGLPAERIVVKPNFVDFPEQPSGQRAGLLFVGRLSREKGIDLLARAWACSSVSTTLSVAGSGPEGNLLNGLARVNLLGPLLMEDVRLAMGRASALVLPSIWYENFPRTLVEAYGSGLPVIASRLGALGELVEDGVSGLLFNPNDARDLASKMEWAIGNSEQLAKMGRNARAKYESDFTAERNYAQTIAIYRDAISDVEVR